MAAYPYEALHGETCFRIHDAASIFNFTTVLSFLPLQRWNNHFLFTKGPENCLRPYFLIYNIFNTIIYTTYHFYTQNHVHQQIVYLFPIFIFSS